MTTSGRAIFDGEVLRPEQPIDLQPNTTYLITIEHEVPAGEGTAEETYPLTEIARLSTDMGVTDLSARHSWYTRRRIEKQSRQAALTRC